MSGVFTGLSLFSAVFFVPSLAIRYAGSRPFAGTAALFLAVAALVGSVALLLKQRRIGREPWGLLSFIGIGAAVAFADSKGLLPLPLLDTLPQLLELQLLRRGVLFLVSGGAAAALFDVLRAPWRRK
jgi:hypothetical protein